MGESPRHGSEAPSLREAIRAKRLAKAGPPPEDPNWRPGTLAGRASRPIEGQLAFDLGDESAEARPPWG
jgi:hypothetical protein